MTPSKFNFEVFQSSLETEILRVVQRSLDRRNAVFVSPTLLNGKTNYDGIRFPKKYREILTAIIISWYSDYFEEFSDYVRYEIQLYLDQNRIFPELNASLVSKNCCDFVICYFISVHGMNDFFGNVLNPKNINRVLNLIQIRVIHPVKERRPVYRRGYKDKGTLRPETQWLPKDDFSFWEEQRRIEEEREAYKDQVHRIVRASGDWILKRRSIRKE